MDISQCGGLFGAPSFKVFFPPPGCVLLRQKVLQVKFVQVKSPTLARGSATVCLGEFGLSVSEYLVKREGKNVPRLPQYPGAVSELWLRDLSHISLIKNTLREGMVLQKQASNSPKEFGFLFL